MVPVGELEGFYREFGKQGWVQNVLELGQEKLATHADFSRSSRVCKRNMALRQDHKLKSIHFLCKLFQDYESLCIMF